MKLLKILITLLATTFSTDLIAQTVHLKAELILTSGDTVKGNVVASRNFFYERMIIETSFNEKLRFVNQLDENIKYKWNDVSRLTLVDLEGKDRLFVQKAGYPRLLEVIYINKVAWFKNYYKANSSQDVSYEIYDESGKKYSLGIFSSKKNKLTSLCSGKDQIISFIKDHPMTDDNILQVLKMYELELK